ncbi:hypothetical protein PV325_012727 [Microctonus aethiopoides]|uniref:GTP-binding protein 10 n=1 Tax=Microctonus aethiopoides TaxID=144406 RepID=A0AA39FWJ1_9HYME|nr:hypothetical protein PV325_012727 [Microctonus aethiopoides]KAK0083450.1 hypothetical protein PV326_006717 [Microctonus aethiopoides]KAK0176524.1 hypothetical protein PV328_000650 [Microctonus aethiopoides]
MVVFTNILGYAAKRAPRKYLRKGFLDSLNLRVKGGTGGMGLPRYGGIGGKGGDVVAVATEDLTLTHLADKYKDRKIVAEHGNHSEQKGIIGVPGNDVLLPVPRGVTVYRQNVKIGEIDEENSKLILARGGIGGCESTGFSGQKGENHIITLDLKLIADVALVGFPNAGKSTLLKSISNAKPKVAQYPFTTVKPQLGIVEYPDLRTIKVADLPGLIEGAHVNIGMGHKFLKHLDRTKLLVFIVDIQGFRLSVRHNYRDCLQTIVLLNKELELYKPDLLNMHAILIVNKMDTADAEKKFKEIEPALNDLETIIDKVPAEIQPEKVLQFNEIITTSLINQDTNEINMVKERIRYHLDKQAEMESEKSADNSKEVELFKKLKKQLYIHTPTLV